MYHQCNAIKYNSNKDKTKIQERERGRDREKDTQGHIKSWQYSESWICTGGQRAALAVGPAHCGDPWTKKCPEKWKFLI